MKHLLLLLLTACTGSCMAQYDTLRQKGSYTICLGYKSNCQAGAVTANEQAGVADTTLALLRGKIVNAQNEGIPFAQIRLTNIASKETYPVAADLSGQYKTWLKAGQYQVQVAFFRYKPLEIPLLSLKSGEIHLLNINLGGNRCAQTKTVISEGPGKGFREEYNSGTQLCEGRPPIDSNEPARPLYGPDSTVSYWNSGQKRLQAYFRNCKPAGAFTEWYENGQMLLRGEYAEGKKTGLWTMWYNTGAIASREYYHDGGPLGTWLSYNYGGDIVKAVIYKSHNTCTSKTIDRQHGVTVITVTHLYRSGAVQKTVIEPGSNTTTTEYTSQKGVMKRKIKKSGSGMSRYEYRLTDKGKLKVKKG